MSVTVTPPATLERIHRHLVGLKMPRALEVLDPLLRQIERGEISTLDAIEMLLGEELTLREGRRVKAALKMGRLLTIKTLARPWTASTSPSSRHSTATAFSRSLSWTSSIGTRWSIFSVSPAAARPIWRSPSAWRRSRPAAPSTLPLWPT